VRYDVGDGSKVFFGIMCGVGRLDNSGWRVGFVSTRRVGGLEYGLINN
jgi:hypothetical protein